MVAPHADRSDAPYAGPSVGTLPLRPGADAPSSVTDSTGPLLDEVLRATTPENAASLWARRMGGRERTAAAADWLLWLDRQIAAIDDAIEGQLNAVLHHPRFQRLEAAWRGLEFLVAQTARCLDRAGEPASRRGSEALVQIRALSVSWKELARDAEQAIEFDQSALFRKVYEAEFGTPGGKPFGLLVGDYHLRHRLGDGYAIDDLATLTALAGVAGAAFAPFVAAADPALLGLSCFAELAPHLDLEREQSSLEYLKWRALRRRDDARYIGLTVPRVLLRPPYRDDPSRRDGFRFQEQVEGPDASKYLWGNAAFALAAVLVRAFVDSRWFADIRGTQRETDERAVAAGRTVVEAGGLVSGLAVDSFHTDCPGVAPKISTEIAIDDDMEAQLSRLGLIPLAPCPDSEFCAFYANQSLHSPPSYSSAEADISAKLGAMLQYTLCVSRVAHYVKVLARDWVGKTSEAEELQTYLHNWLANYVTDDRNASPENKAKKPLREANVQVDPIPSQPGSYKCTMRLVPHFQLDALSASVRLTTVLAPVTG